MRLALAALVLVFGLGCPAPSIAQPRESIELVWNVPDGCPSAEAVLARVRQIAGAGPVNVAPLRAEATIAQQADGQYQMQLVIRAGALFDTRSIEGKACKDLVGAAAVALAVALSSLESAAAGNPAVSEQRAEPQTLQAPPVAPVAGASEPSPPRRWHGLLGLPLASLGAGPLRESSLGLGLAAGASFDDWRLLAEGRLWASRSVTRRELLDDYGADLRRVTVTLRGCRSVWGSRFEIAPCALVSLHHLTASGRGPHIAPRSPEVVWLAAGVGLRARLLLAPWFGLFAAADGEVQLSRPEIDLEGVGTLGRLAPAAATITVGSEWIL